MKTGITVYDAMTSTPIYIGPNETAEQCAKIMREHDVGNLLIKEGHRLIGILTEQGLVHKIIARGLDPKKIVVSDIMVREVKTIEPDADIYDALIAMQEKDIRQLPVMHNYELIGILTLKDILKIEPELFEIYIDKLNLKEEDRKIFPTIEANCEICGKYKRLKEFDGQLLCNECVVFTE
ncbi:CBS domain-containing protein [Candidatus Woesearchaeota archaeon]|nr:CBS domain-containing protein [Candidatus Woesearchaeota archaeon]